jgi:integrase
MAGVVRKRTWTTRKGEIKSAWVVDYRDQDSRRHLKTFVTKKAADAWLVDVRSEVKSGIHTPDADSITVAEAAKLWLRNCELEGLERGSLRTYDGYVRLHIVPLIGRKKLSRLTTPLVVAFRDALLTRVTRPRGRSVLSALKSLLYEAQRRGLVAQNVALPVRIARNDRDERPLEIGVEVPSKAEVQAMLQHATGRWRARLVTAVFTGLRASELRALCWPDVEFDKRLVSVRRRADWWGTIGRPKSKHGYREIPMTPIVVNTLKEWQLDCPRRKKGGLDLVFPGQAGRVLHHTSLELSFDEIQRAAGVVDAEGNPKYGLHSLRHFFASWGIDQGFSPKRLQTLLGHGSIKMTYDIYGHLFPSPEDDHERFAAGEAAVLGVVPAQS